MKKLSLLVVVALVASSMTSCKKDRTCTCTSTGSAIAEVITINKAKKGDAKKMCTSLSGTYTRVDANNAANNSAGPIAQTCTLK